MDTKTLLFIAHAPSPNTVMLRDAVRNAVETETGLRLIIRSPLEADADDALAADAVLIGTTENIGYMAGATKDFFDRSYNTLLEVSAGKPAAIYIRAGLDGTGSRRALEGIMTGLRWRLVEPVLILHGSWQSQYPDEAAALGLGLAAGLEIGAF